MERCAMCKHEGLVAGNREDEVEVGHRRFVASLPTRECPSCGEAYFEHVDLARFELAVASALVSDGDISPEAFRFMRKTIGLQAIELGELLDVTPETISRWEHGKLPVERRALALLGAMVADQEAGASITLDRLRGLAGRRKKLPKVTRLTEGFGPQPAPGRRRSKGRGVPLRPSHAEG
jgi:putative zinc finger/helix-turn-helix YgiT family protein